MLQTRRSALRVAHSLRRRQQQRYNSNDKPSGHASSAGQAHPTDHGHHPEPVNETFGKGFWITLAVVPLSLAAYKFSTASSDADSQPGLTRLLRRYSDYKGQWTERNTLHTDMAEQAAYDRNLFQSTPANMMVELKFPEIFNTGSPYNVPAGHSTNLDALIAHYEQKNREVQQKVAKRMLIAEDE